MRLRAWCLATSITVTNYRSNASKFTNETENLSKVGQTLCLLEKMAQQACQICHFRNWRVNQTQNLSLPSLPFSEFVPLKRTLRLERCAGLQIFTAGCVKSGLRRRMSSRRDPVCLNMLGVPEKNIQPTFIRVSSGNDRI